MDRKTVICVGYHKPSFLLHGNCFVPVWGGKAVANIPSKDGQGLSQLEKNWMLRNCIGDDTGDNISTKNRHYNESTILYWMWKNLDQLDSPSHIGFLQYRRHWILNEEFTVGKKISISNLIKEETFSFDHQKKIGLSEDKINEVLNECDGIFCTSILNTTVQGYKEAHPSQDIKYWNNALEIIKKDWPQYYEAALTYNNGNMYVWSNCFILPTELFSEYCEMLFDVTNKIDEMAASSYSTMTPEQMRVPGYVSETLLGVWYTYLVSKGYKFKTYPLLHIASPFFSEDELRMNIDLNDKNSIPIVIITDKNYLKYSSVLIESIIKYSSKDRIYNIIIVNDGSIHETDKARLMYSMPCNFNVTFYNATYYFNKYPFEDFFYSRLNKMPYLKLFIYKILSNCKKAIFLDSDIVVTGDIALLYDIDIDGYYLGAVKDKIMGSCTTEFWGRKRNYILTNEKLDDCDKYFNSGVLLLNLELMRQNLDISILINEAKFLHPERCTHDQDTFNFTLKDHIKYIDSVFNIQTSVFSHIYEGFIPEKITNDFKKIIDEKRSIVIHFDGSKQKPWESMLKNRNQLTDIWWLCARNSIFYEEITYHCTVKMLEDQNKKKQKKKVTPPSLKTFRKVKKIDYYRYKIIYFITFGIWKKYEQKYQFFKSIPRKDRFM